MFLSILILALIQGLTEFIPVSSTGHLVIAQNLLGLQPSSYLSLDAWLHLGTLFAILLSMLRELGNLIRYSLLPLARAFFFSLLGTGVMFRLLHPFLDILFDSPNTVPVGLLITAAFLMGSSFFRSTKTSWKQLRDWQFFLIGVFQGIAILPGISRSGSIFFSARMMGLNPLPAVEYALFLSIPTIFLAVYVQWENVFQMFPVDLLLLGLVGTIAFGLAGIFGFTLLGRNRWASVPFSIYCLLLSTFLFLGGMLR